MASDKSIASDMCSIYTLKRKRYLLYYIACIIAYSEPRQSTLKQGKCHLLALLLCGVFQLYIYHRITLKRIANDLRQHDYPS